MSGLREQTTEVLRAHVIRRAPIRSYPTTFRCTCGEWTVQAEDGEEQGAEHVADAVVEALGLTEQNGYGNPLDDLVRASGAFPESFRVRRWVSGWSVVGGEQP